MQESVRLAELMDRVMTGDSWHAGNVMDLLSDVTAREAATRPVPGVHTIWQIVLHLTAWAGEVQARIEGRPAGAPRAGDWPPVGAPTAARWRAARTKLRRAYAGLAASAATLDAHTLLSPVTDPRNREAGTGMSRYLTLHGAIHHAAWHAGQIALLKRALRSRR